MPGSPYPGNPANFPETVPLTTGAGPPSSAVFDTSVEGGLDRTAWLRANFLTTGLTNWGTKVVPPTNSFVTVGQWNAIVYDPIYQRWVAMNGGTGSGSTVDFFDSLDGGKTWTDAFSIGSGSALPTITYGLACDANGNVVLVYTDHSPSGGAVGPHIQFFQGRINYVPVGISGVSNITSAVVYADPGVARFFGIAVDQSGGTFTATGFDVQIPASPTPGVSAPTVTAHTLPSGWASGTNHPGPLLAAPSASLGYTLVAMGGVTAGTDTSQLMTVRWTGSAFVFGAIGNPVAGQIITGIARSERRGLWAVLSYDGTNTHLYTTPDLLTWATAGSVAGLSSGLACVGPLWLALLEDKFASTWRPSITQDDGATWHPGAAALGSLSAAQLVVGTPSGSVDPFQAIAINATGLYPSLFFGLS